MRRLLQALRTMDPGADAVTGQLELARFRDHAPDARAYAAVLRHDPCCYCGSTDRVQVDHVEAYGPGGSCHWTNLTAACIACNSSKMDRRLLVWLLTSPRMQSRRYPQLDLMVA